MMNQKIGRAFHILKQKLREEDPQSLAELLDPQIEHLAGTFLRPLALLRINFKGVESTYYLTYDPVNNVFQNLPCIVE